MPRSGYSKISSDDDEEVSFTSALFFRWMNGVLNTGSQRPLDQDDFLPLQEENSACFVTEKFRESWENKKVHCKKNGEKPKLWKSVFQMLSVEDVIIILLGNSLFTASRLLFPLPLGYLVAKLMSTETGHSISLYACALALCFNGLIGSLGMHHQDYKGEVLGIRISSALRGLVYHKVSTVQLNGTKAFFCYS